MIDIFPKFTDHFRKFLIQNKVFVTIVGMLIGAEMRTLVLSFTTNLIDPLFDIDLNNDQKKDFQCLFDSEMTFYGVKLKYGKVIKDVVHFVVMIVFAYSIAYFTNELSISGL